MALDFKHLDPSQIAPFVQSLFVDKKGTGNKKIALGLQDLGILKDFLIKDNPLLAYSKDIQVSEVGSGSITVKRNVYKDGWKKKAALGHGTVANVELDEDVLKWHAPYTLTEGMSAFDLSKGIPNVLGHRLATNGTKFVQKSIQDGFASLIAAAGTGTVVTPTAAKDYRALRLQFIQTATRLVKATQRPRNMITITVDPETFDGLAEAGLIGDRANITFTSGQYAVGIIGGYVIQSGSMFLPDKTLAVIATSDAIAYNTQIVAANTGQIGISSDIGTYLEMTTIADAPKFTEEDGLVKHLHLA